MVWPGHRGWHGRDGKRTESCGGQIWRCRLDWTSERRDSEVALVSAKQRIVQGGRKRLFDLGQRRSWELCTLPNGEIVSTWLCSSCKCSLLWWWESFIGQCNSAKYSTVIYLLVSLFFFSQEQNRAHHSMFSLAKMSSGVMLEIIAGLITQTWPAWGTRRKIRLLIKWLQADMYGLVCFVTPGFGRIRLTLRSDIGKQQKHFHLVSQMDALLWQKMTLVDGKNTTVKNVILSSVTVSKVFRFIYHSKCHHAPSRLQTNNQLSLSDRSVASRLTCLAEKLHWNILPRRLPITQ